MATIDGARVLGLENQTGSLTPGKGADVIVVRPDFTELSSANHIEGAISLTEPSNVQHVFVDGICVKSDG